MKILRILFEGIPLFKDNLDIDFIARQRVEDDDKDQLFNLFSNIYVNPVLSFIGINASGKTTILKAISFVIELLNNRSINNIPSKEILNNMEEGQKAVLSSFFYQEEILYKLRTVIQKKEDQIDGTAKYTITEETLWAKEIKKVKTKKGIYDFSERMKVTERNKDEAYLLEDVSIIVALNKKTDTELSLYDMSKFTDHNMLNVLGKHYPKEILTFLDPSIEYLICKPNEKRFDIKLKFYGKEEINLNDLLSLNKYLSSGTIKGLSVFMQAVFAFSDGGYLSVDELENHFNREIVTTLVRFFMDKRINKRGATLIFSTHYSELLDVFERNDNIYIVRNKGGITAENLNELLDRSDIKKSEVYDSDFLKGTAPAYDSYLALKKALVLLR